MALFVGAVHIIWACLLYASQSATFVTVHNDVSSWLGSRYTLATLMLVAGVMAIWGWWKRLTIVWMVPQQMMLFMSSIAAIDAMRESAFGDGVERPRVFIAADQMWIVIATIVHASSIANLGRRGGN